MCNWREGAVFEDYLAVHTEYILNVEDARRYEFDVYAEKPDGLSLVFEVKNREKKVGIGEVRDFVLRLNQLKGELTREGKAAGFTADFAGIYVSRSGFTSPAKSLMAEQGIMYADFGQWFGEEHLRGGADPVAKVSYNL